VHRHIGEDTDIPAGDIGYLFGQYKRLENRFTGMLTRRGLSFGVSRIRTEATGYGCVYFCENMFQERNKSIAGKRVAVSGNVAICAVKKATQFGAKVVTLSDSSGFIYAPDGIDEENLAYGTGKK